MKTQTIHLATPCTLLRQLVLEGVLAYSGRLECAGQIEITPASGQALSFAGSAEALALLYQPGEISACTFNQGQSWLSFSSGPASIEVKFGVDERDPLCRELGEKRELVRTLIRHCNGSRNPSLCRSSPRPYSRFD